MEEKFLWDFAEIPMVTAARGVLETKYLFSGTEIEAVNF
jgi:hypothetical protein